MKRKFLLSILMCLSLLLCSCAGGDGESQFTQIDSKYLQTDKADTPEATEQAKSSQEENVSEKSELDAESKSAKENPEVDNSPKKKSEKKSKKSSTTVEKEDVTKNDKNADKKTSHKTLQENSNKEENKEKKTSTKDKKTDKKETSSKKENVKVENTSEPEISANFCTVSIDCHTILTNMDELDSAKKDFVPKDGWILKSTKVTLEKGDTAYDVLYKVCQKYKIHMEAAYTPAYGTYYVEGINQLYEFDCGDLSGWTFLVNGESLNYGCSKYTVNTGDVIEWRFSCNAGRDTKN